MNSSPWRCHKPCLALCASPLPWASERLACAAVSAGGATYSPTSTPASINTSIGFMTAQTIRPIDTPAARMMVSSLLLARLPRPIRQPISAAIGSISYIRRGAVNNT
ncbi:hypothetical protein D9M73_159440 [compost metagenome]